MVTIEEKLALFSKLLQQEIKEEVDKATQEIEQKYEKTMEKDIQEAKTKASQLISQATKRADAQAIKRTSTAKLEAQKEQMRLKQSFVEAFNVKLEEKIKAFLKTPEYRDFLIQSLKKANIAQQGWQKVSVYMCKQDITIHQQTVIDYLMTQGFEKDHITIIQAKEWQLGGLIIRSDNMNTQIDLSVTKRLEEGKQLINESIFSHLKEEVD